MGNTTYAPPARLVTWLGGRTYRVEDLRELHMPDLFLLTDEGRTQKIRVKAGELADEIAKLWETGTPTS